MRWRRVLACSIVTLLPLAYACGGIVEKPEKPAPGATSSGTSTDTASTADDGPDDPSLAVPVPGTATVTAPPCAARFDACASGLTNDAWARGIVRTCAAKVGIACGPVDFAHEIDGSCADHVVFDSGDFPPAFVACVVAKAKAQRCGAPRPIAAGVPLEGEFIRDCR